MKTLVIHPTDVSTDFLKVIYEGKDWTVINKNPANNFLKEQIKNHDRIIMLGHGTEEGLIGFKRFVINSKLVYLLREKQCIAIWCNADQFMKKYDLKGFYTGMIISEYDEAIMFLNSGSFNITNIADSNLLFADSVKESIEEENMLESLKLKYDGDNSIIEFNKQNLYHR